MELQVSYCVCTEIQEANNIYRKIYNDIGKIPLEE